MLGKHLIVAVLLAAICLGALIFYVRQGEQRTQPGENVTYPPSRAWDLTDNENILSEIIEQDDFYFTVTEKWCEISWNISPTEPISNVTLWVVADAPIEFPLIYWYTWNGSEWIRESRIFVQSIETESTHDLTQYLPDPDNEFKIRIYQGSDMWNSTGRLNRVSLSITYA